MARAQQQIDIESFGANEGGSQMTVRQWITTPEIGERSRYYRVFRASFSWYAFVGVAICAVLLLPAGKTLGQSRRPAQRFLEP
jgi:hypothetical protein